MRDLRGESPVNVIEQHKKIGLKHICSLAGICLVVTQALAQDPANKKNERRSKCQNKLKRRFETDTAHLPRAGSRASTRECAPLPKRSGIQPNSYHPFLRRRIWVCPAGTQPRTHTFDRGRSWSISAAGAGSTCFWLR